MLVDYINFDNRSARTQYIHTRFKKYLGGKVLDVGCDEAILKKLLPELDYTGVDISGSPDIRLNLEKIERLPFDDSTFDSVICADVLEHLDNLHLIFQELLRVSKDYVIVAWPNNWSVARVPIERGRGSFRHYGLPPEKPADRHKWFFGLTEARDFVIHRTNFDSDVELIEIRVSEKPRLFIRRWIRRLCYPREECYLNRYAHTLWTVLKKSK